MPCLRAEIYCRCAFCGGTHLGLEHEVELAYVCPVACAGDRTYDFLVEDYLLQSVKVYAALGIHDLLIAVVEGVALGEELSYFRRCGTILLLVEILLETLACFLHLLLYLLLVLGYLVFDEDIGTIALLGVTVVYERVVESIDVAGCLPYCRVHEYSRIDTHDILMHEHHVLPPVLLDIVFQFDTVLTVVIYSAQSVINL